MGQVVRSVGGGRRPMEDERDTATPMTPFCLSDPNPVTPGKPAKA